MTTDVDERRDALADAKPWAPIRVPASVAAQRHDAVAPASYRLGYRDPEEGQVARCHICGTEIVFPLSRWVHRDPERDA